MSDCNPSSPDHLQSLLQSQGNVVKTEYSTFTYFITSLENGQTVTSTDIVVSSNVVTSLPSIEATPLLQDVASDQVSENPVKTRLARLKTKKRVGWVDWGLGQELGQ